MLGWVWLSAAGLLFGLSAMSVLRASSMPQFFVSLVATEAGILLVIPVAFVAYFGLSPSALGLATVSLAGLAGLLLMAPTLRASWYLRKRNLRDPRLLGVVTRQRLDFAGGQVAECFSVRDGRRKPLVYVVHGGGWEGGEPAECPGFLTRLARMGCVVASGSYRLGHPWPAPMQDVIAGLRQVLDRSEDLGIDPARVYLLGRSAGGQIASAVACSGEVPALRGCICLYAPFDLLFAYEHAREDDALNSLGLLRRFLGGTSTEARENYISASAWHQASAGAPPFLLIHGSRDDLVWVRQSQRFAERLKELGVPCRYLELPWANHSFDHIEHGPGSRVALAAIHEFVFSDPALDSPSVPGRN